MLCSASTVKLVAMKRYVFISFVWSGSHFFYGCSNVFLLCVEQNCSVRILPFQSARVSILNPRSMLSLLNGGYFCQMKFYGNNSMSRVLLQLKIQLFNFIKFLMSQKRVLREVLKISALWQHWVKIGVSPYFQQVFADFSRKLGGIKAFRLLKTGNLMQCKLRAKVLDQCKSHDCRPLGETSSSFTPHGLIWIGKVDFLLVMILLDDAFLNTLVDQLLSAASKVIENLIGGQTNFLQTSLLWS